MMMGADTSNTWYWYWGIDLQASIGIGIGIEIPDFQGIGIGIGIDHDQLPGIGIGIGIDPFALQDQYQYHGTKMTQNACFKAHFLANIAIISLIFP